MMINVVGPMNTVRAFLPYMYRQERGRFIIVSSLSGRLTYVGEPAYITSKHAQVAGTIRYCFEQPDRCTIYEISLRPKNQLL
jgi:NADP-dependent 3-hydroxy acid dehydrogenase YdfG